MATAWQTIAKRVEREINEIPMGFLSKKTSEFANPLLRMLSPSSLKLQTRSDRAPRSNFTIPNSPEDIMTTIDKLYTMWYTVWARDYVPLVMGHDKWLKEEQNLAVDDVVWFKLKESPMSAQWRIGKVEAVHRGRDGLVREADVAYKQKDSDDLDEWRHLVVLRPIRNMVKLFAMEDTTLMQDLGNVQKLMADDQDQVETKQDLTKTPRVKQPRAPRTNEEGKNLVTEVQDDDPKTAGVHPRPRKKRTEVDRLALWSHFARQMMCDSPSARSDNGECDLDSMFISLPSYLNVNPNETYEQQETTASSDSVSCSLHLF